MRLIVLAVLTIVTVAAAAYTQTLNFDNGAYDAPQAAPAQTTGGQQVAVPAGTPNFKEWTPATMLSACANAGEQNCTALNQPLGNQPIDETAITAAWARQMGSTPMPKVDFAKLNQVAGLAQQMAGNAGGTANINVTFATAWIHPIMLVTFTMQKGNTTYMREDLSLAFFNFVKG